MNKFYVTYTAAGGLDGQVKAADKVLEIGEQYELLSAMVYSSFTYYTLKGKSGTFNSCLFNEYSHKQLPPHLVEFSHKMS